MLDMRYWSTVIFLLLLSFCIFAEDNLMYGIPGEADLLINREGFALGYSHEHRQALWICYVLTKKNLLREQTKRTNKFLPDPAITFCPVQPQDYNRTGYDRGHLAPAADMTYSFDAMLHSFFMSNISPQIPGCNRGIWKRIENQARKWAKKEGRLYIITGPIFGSDRKWLGKTGIPIPTGFYKIILDMTPPMKMIAFITPNQPSKKRVYSFVTTVDHIEELTGFDFFSKMEDALEAKLEKEADFSLW